MSAFDVLDDLPKVLEFETQYSAILAVQLVTKTSARWRNINLRQIYAFLKSNKLVGAGVTG